MLDAVAIQQQWCPPRCKATQFEAIRILEMRPAKIDQLKPARPCDEKKEKMGLLIVRTRYGVIFFSGNKIRIKTRNGNTTAVVVMVFGTINSTYVGYIQHY